MKAQHTAGPWQVTHLRNGIEHVNLFRIGGPSTPKVNDQCSAIFQSYDEHNECNEANARLIAAAPDLLEALLGMLEWARRVKECNPGPEVAEACAAIDKAAAQAGGE